MQTDKLTIEAAVDKLIDNFVRYKNAKLIKQGGQMRNLKGKAWQSFFIQGPIMNAIHNHNLDHIVKAEHRIEIKAPLNISADAFITNKNNKPLYFIEIKDYMDIDMYKRFAFDTYLLKEYGCVKFISLCGWVASSSAQCDIVNKYLGYPELIHNFTLFPETRTSKNDLFILSHTREDIIKATEELTKKLETVIL